MIKKMQLKDFYGYLDVQYQLLKSESLDYRHLTLAIAMQKDWIMTSILKDNFNIDYSTIYAGFINNAEYKPPGVPGEISLIVQESIYDEFATFEENIMEEIFINNSKAMRSIFSVLKIDFDEFLKIYVNKYKAEKSNSNIAAFCTPIKPESDIKEILLRDDVLFKIYISLGKKTKSNVILFGDAGVGKTAIVEELARQIKYRECPTIFNDYEVLNLDVVSALSGTRLRGEFEERIQAFIDCMSKDNKYIVFIDEVQNIVGAGAGQDSKLDLSNMLKPLLARDNIRLIGATTINELSAIQKDKALARRFEYIEISEPSNDKVYDMIKNKVSSLSKYHNIKFTKKDIDSIINYCIKMESTLCFPDKAIDVIDSLMSMTKMKKEKVINLSYLSECATAFDYKKIKSKYTHKQNNQIGF